MPSFKELFPVAIILLTSALVLSKPLGPGSRFFDAGPAIGPAAGVGFAPVAGAGQMPVSGPVLAPGPISPNAAPGAIPPPPPPGPVPILAGPHGVEEIVVESPNQIRHSVKHDMRSSKREETVFDADDRFPTTTVTLDDDYGTTVYKKPLMRPGFGMGMGMGGFVPGPEPGYFGYPMGNSIARSPGWGHPVPFGNNAFF